MTSLTELMSMTGRTALITGGAGHLGSAMAEALAELGADLCLVDRDVDALRATVARLTLAGRSRAEIFAVDLEDETARIDLLQRVVERMGRLDVLVNNAAFVGDREIDGWATPFAEQSIETWRRAMEVITYSEIIRRASRT